MLIEQEYLPVRKARFDALLQNFDDIVAARQPNHADRRLGRLRHIEQIVDERLVRMATE